MCNTPVSVSDIRKDGLSEQARFAAAVAGFGLLLRNSQYKGDITYDKVISPSRDAMKDDSLGLR
ncbi:MAG: YfbK domain-containing protein, partial [Chitinivibrionales bacterium]